MDVGKILSDALKAVSDANIPTELQEIAFSKAVDLLSGGTQAQVPHGAAKPPGQPQGSTPGSTDSGGSSGPANTEAELYRRMSEGTGVPVETLERLVHLDGGVPKILLKKSQLPKQTSNAQKAITLILTVATYYLTGEEEVDLSPIREETKQLSYFDANYIANIGGISDITITGPKGGNKKVKVRKAFLHSFKDELTKYGLISE